MPQSLKSLSLVTFTLLLSVAFPLQAARATSKLSSVLAQVPTPQDYKAAPNVEGTWTITEAKTLDGRNYTGTVAIQAMGQIYELSWQTSVGKQSGIGFFEDGHFFVGWGTDEAAGYGVVLYKIGKDGTLEGKWTSSQQGGEIGTEIATGGKPNQIEGDYQVSGTNPNETGGYKGTLNIRKTGDTYQVTWVVGTTYRGVGIRSGDWLVVSWGQSEQLGVVDYAISGDNASGRSARFNQSFLGVENLVRTQASANLLRSCTPTQTPTTQSRKAEADCFLEQGIKLIDTKRFQAALQSLQQALTIYKELKDRQGEGQVLKNLGNVYYAQKDYKKAIEFQQQALTLAREIRDRELEGRALNNLGLAYKGLGDSAKAIESYQQALVIAREIHNRKLEQIALNNLGFIYTALKNSAKAVEYYQQILAIAREAQNHDLEWSALTSIVSAYDSLKDTQKIIKFAQQGLTLARKTQNRTWERLALNTLIGAYTSFGDFQKVVEYRQQLLAIARETKDRQSAGKVLIDIGLAYDALKNYQQAIAAYQQSLAISQEISDRVTEGWALNNLGWVYDQQGNYSKAIDYYQQSLAIAQAITNNQMQLKVLTNLGNVYLALENYSKAIEYHQESLTIAQKTSDRVAEGWSLNNLGGVYHNQGNYNKAIDYYQRSLAIAQTISNYQIQVNVLTNLGNTHNFIGDSQKATDLAQQTLALARENKNRELESAALIVLSSTYWSRRDYQKMIEFAQESLAISQEIKNRNLESIALSNLGLAYMTVRDYQKGIEYQQQSLAIHRELNNRSFELVELHNLSVNYISLGDYQKVIELAEQELALAREMKNRQYEGISLAVLGFARFAQGDSQKAIEFGQQALAVGREFKNPRVECFALLVLSIGYSNLGNSKKALELSQQMLAIAREPQVRQVIVALEQVALNTLGNNYRKLGQKEQAIIAYRESLAIDDGDVTAKAGLARIYRDLNMPITAITYYKQAIDEVERTRSQIVKLPRQLQESILQAVLVDRSRITDMYRELADLLLSQGRILEAQQVLELLKVQELRDFTKDTRTGGKDSEVALNQTEEQIKKENGTLIAFGQKLYECQQARCSQLSQLLKQRQVLTEQFNQKIQTIEKQVRDRKANDDAFLDPSKLNLKAKEIIEAQPGTVLIYPLVLEDRIWLLWASKGGILKSVEVPVGQRQLAQTVVNFRQLLQNKKSDITHLKATGKQLYDWLIKPIESELKSNEIQNLVFSLDRTARYIPMSALYDGEKYLIENYTVSTIVSADLTDLRDRTPLTPQNTSVLALGLSEGVAGFNPLPNVPAELDAIVRKKPTDNQGIYPGLEFLNKAFNFQSLLENLIDHQLVHIATHGQFVPGKPDASYLLLGTGEQLTIRKIATLQDLGNTQLVVLSACETALGEPGQDGVEINGISYYFLNSGAKAVMASLWKVNDDSTRQLMQNFYSDLAKGTATAPITKAQALRQAQLSLLHGNPSKPENLNQRSSLEPEARLGSPTSSTPSTSPGFSHPYYWAPFILIGNSL